MARRGSAGRVPLTHRGCCIPPTACAARHGAAGCTPAADAAAAAAFRPAVAAGARAQEVVELLQAASAILASANSLSFTAVATYQSPARTGLPLAYSILSQVTLE